MKVLVIQNRMGIGDLFIFLPYICNISKEFDTPVSLLARENSRAKDLLKDNPYIKEVIILDRDDKNKSGRHQGILGTLNLITDLRKYKFNKSFTFNSSARYAFITKMAGINERYQYSLFKKKNQNIIETAKNFVNKHLKKKINYSHELFINEAKINKTLNNI